MEASRKSHQRFATRCSLFKAPCSSLAFPSCRLFSLPSYLIAVMQGITCSPLPTNSEIQAVQVQLHCSSPNIISWLHDDLALLSAQYPQNPIFLLGNINFPSIRWNSDIISCSSNADNCREFLDLCLTFNLSQVLTFPTCTTDSSSNILHLVLCSKLDCISSLQGLKGNTY